MEGTFRDGEVRRRRPKIIVHETDATSQKLKERAERRAKRSAGFSRTADITVSGWRDRAGLIFEPHFLIGVMAPRLYIEGDMVIKSVTLTQSMNGDGTRAQLSLADPRALNGEAPGGATDGVWNAPGGGGGGGRVGAR